MSDHGDIAYGRVDDLRVAAVATPQSTPDQVEFFLTIAGERCGNAGFDPEAGAPCGGSAASVSNGGDSGSAACPGGGDWIGGIGNVAPKFTFGEFGPSAAVSTGTHSTGLEYGGVFFSCGKPGHSANRCPTLDDSFPFMLPGWWAEKGRWWLCDDFTPAAAERRQAENGD